MWSSWNRYLLMWCMNGIVFWVSIAWQQEPWHRLCWTHQTDLKYKPRNAFSYSGRHYVILHIEMYTVYHDFITHKGQKMFRMGYLRNTKQIFLIDFLVYKGVFSFNIYQSHLSISTIYTTAYTNNNHEELCK